MPENTLETTPPSLAHVREARSPGLAATARGITRTYGRGDSAVHALRGVDLDLPAGRFTAVMGASGSGKSTLMHCLAGLDQPTSGTVTVAGTELQSLDDTRLTLFRREQLGFVFQSFNLLPMLTAGQNIVLPLELAGRRVSGELRERYDHVVEVLGLADRLGHRPGELSGGQQQRVAIARALVTRPALIFADEPTGNLDSESSAEVLGFLRRSVRELGQTVVMVTHELDAAGYADSFVDIAPAADDAAPTENLVVVGKTYMTTAKGSIGLQLDGFAYEDGLSAQGSRQRVVLSGLEANRDYRTNLALFLTPGSTGSAQVDVRVLDSFGRESKKISSVGLNGDAPFVQIGNDSLFAGLTTGEMSRATIVIDNPRGTAVVGAYATVIDNRSEDATFVAGQPAP